MKKEIIVSYCKTFNLGNYESEKIHASITCAISEKDDRSNDEIFEELFTECVDFVLKQAKE